MIDKDRFLNSIKDGESQTIMVVHRDYRDSSDGVIKIFDDRINLLLAFIFENENLSARTISENMNEPLRTIQRWIKQLKDEGKIEYRGSKKTGGYYVGFGYE